MKKNELKQSLKEQAVKLYETKEAEFPEPEQLRETGACYPSESHRQKVDGPHRRYGSAPPGYRSAGLWPEGSARLSTRWLGYEMFNEMTASIQQDTIRMLYHVKVEQKVEREEVAKVTGTNKDDSSVQAPKKRETIKIYPNDPCPCGSGKKYKQCCGRKPV